jgi:hypothetical protein
MRFLVAIGVAACGATSVEQPRFLVQSVVEKRGGKSFATVLGTEKASDPDFCVAASSLVTTAVAEEEKTTTLYEQLSSVTNAEMTSVGSQVDSMVASIREDNSRYTTDLGKAVTATIVTELSWLQTIANDQLTKMTWPTEEDSKPELNLDSETVLQGGVDVLARKEGDQYSLSARPSSGNPVDGYAHRGGTWAKMIEGFKGSKTALGELANTLTKLQAGVKLRMEQINTSFDSNEVLPAANGRAPEVKPGELDNTDCRDDPHHIGARIVDLIAKGDETEMKTFIEEKEVDPVAEMEKLTTILYLLKVREMGLVHSIAGLNKIGQDLQGEAAEANSEEKKRVGPVTITGLETEITEQKTAIAESLAGILPLAKKVYELADLLPDVHIDKNDETANVKYNMQKLRELVKAKSAHAELLPLFNLVVNMVYQLHVNLAGFVASDQITAKSEPGPDGALFGDARCMLYGAVDVLLVNNEKMRMGGGSLNCDELRKRGRLILGISDKDNSVGFQ